MHEHVPFFRKAMQDIGLECRGDASHPIVPVMLYDAQVARKMANLLMQHYNIYVTPFSYPVVPKEQARIRI